MTGGVAVFILLVGRGCLHHDSLSVEAQQRLKASPGLLSHQTPAVLVQRLQQLEKERSVCLVAYWFLHWSFE